MAIKFNADLLVYSVWFHQPWNLFDGTLFRIYLWQSLSEGARAQVSADRGFLLLWLATSLPFLWAGLVLTLRRLGSLGWRPWWILLIFVPVVKLFFFLLLCLLPSCPGAEYPAVVGSRSARRWSAMLPTGIVGSSLLGAILSSGLGLLLVWVVTIGLGSYGWALFVSIPFMMGFLSTLIHSYRQPRGIRSCLLTGIISVLFAGVGLLAFAMEGAICILMAAPLALALSVFGAVIGYIVQKTFTREAGSPRLFCVAVLFTPVMMGLERAAPPSLPILEVKSSLVVNAPAEIVWRHVVSFSQLPPPREAIFKLGVAYPIHAEIDGRGVGAVRHCDFSTGPFVEPIEVWDEPRLLKFSVTQNPEPMQEWTFYRRVHPPHLDGYLQSCAGQFRLVAVDPDHTLLEGTTWYYHHLWPADYWQVWSDYIIHTIHLRVLNHVKQLSENDRIDIR